MKMTTVFSHPRAVSWKLINYYLPLAAKDYSCNMLPVKVVLFEKADPSLVSIKIELTGHLGVLISLLARRRRKYILLFFLKVKFWRVVRTFLTTSRQPLDQFGWNLARLLPDSFSTKPCLRILISLFLLKLDLFSEQSANLFIFSDFIC